MSAVRWLHEARSAEGLRFRIGRRGGTLIAEWDHLLRVEAPARGAARILVAEESRVTRKLRAGPVPALLGHLHGTLHWHASACAWPGQPAVLVVGASGTGKSTLVAGLGTVGAAFLADDVCAVVRRGRSFVVSRTETQHAIRPDMVSMLYGTEASTKALFAPQRRRRAAPLGLLLRIEVGEELALRPLPMRTRLQVVQQNLVRFALDDPQRLERDLDFVIDLLAQLPMVTLVRPPRFDDWAALRDLLGGRLRDSLPPA